MRRDLASETVLPFPVEAVWEALTDPAALAEWVMPVEGFAPVVGQRFRFLAKPMPGWDGVIDCEVLAIEPLHRMVLRWQGSRMRTPTTVTWTVTPVEAAPGCASTIRGSMESAGCSSRRCTAPAGAR